MNVSWKVRSLSADSRMLSALLFAGLVSIAACDGGNAFTGDDPDARPQVLALSLPQVATAGETLSMRVDAEAGYGVSQIVVSLRGAVNADTSIILTTTASRMSRTVTFKVPNAIQDTLLFVQASVIDKRGTVSFVRQGTIVVFGPPTITSLLTPGIVQLGELVSVRVSVFGSRRVSNIDVAARGAVQKDTSVAVSPARSSVVQDIVLRLPSEAQDTIVNLSITARDEIGQGSQPVTRSIPIVIEPPIVEITTPSIAHAGLNLDVQVHASGLRQIGQIRVELRGAHVTDVNVTITPPQSDVVQNVSIPLPANILLSDLRVRAAVVDRGQIVAWSPENLVTIPLGPPAVTALETPLQAYGGKVMDIRVRASGDRPISKVDVRYRGVVDTDKSYVISPARTLVVQDSWVSIPMVASDQTITVLATVTDVSGAVSEITSTNIPVLPPPPAPARAGLALGQVGGPADAPWQRNAFRIVATRPGPGALQVDR